MTNPASYDITLRRGNDYEQLFVFQQPDESAMSLSGYVVKSQIRVKKDRTSELLVEFTVAIPDPTNGKVYLRLTDTQTSDLTRSSGFYDILLTSPSGFDEIYLEGKVFINRTVTMKA